MILTSHRLDCFRLCMDLLVGGGSAARFDRVVILCSGVKGRHLRYVQSLPGRHPGIRWDVIHGLRGRGKVLSDMQNECVRRYPGGLYFKLDEDTFVSSDWDIEMEKAYEAFKDDHDLALLSAVVTNNQRGAYHLLTVFPELGEEFTRTFNKPIVTERMGPVWILPRCAAFMIRSFLNLDEGNRRLREANRKAMGDGVRDSGYGTRDVGDEMRDSGYGKGDKEGLSGTSLSSEQAGLSRIHGSTSEPAPRNPDPASRIPHPVSCITFSYPFSINCICYDYRHWQEIGGVPEEDENGWGTWIPENGKFIVLVADALVHHYSFFVQQAWLDRTSLLEDIRKVNLPDTYRPFAGLLARLKRIVTQIPGALMRRMKKS